MAAVDVPYHLVKACRGIIFAARGSDIHSFNSSFEHISTWKYPSAKGETQSEAQSSPAPEGPPAKRRKLEEGEEPASNGREASSANVNGQGKPKGWQDSNPALETPWIQGLYITSDGHHVVAITNSDKTIWVFEHDGAGNLKQLSQRPMPKRPCALAIMPDDRVLLSADKFGDVYALPLTPSDHLPIPSQHTLISRSVTPGTPSTTGGSTPIPRLKADETVVHTKRNLKALENQKKAALERKQPIAQDNRPQFEHALLLGHVSMLTAICVAQATSPVDGKTRTYILTGDRDEHIRVSRGALAQAHVIEGFCMGHEEFVSRLCMVKPASGQGNDVLVSGGGDDDLYSWDLVHNKLVGKAPLLPRVQEVVGEEANKLAVTRIVAQKDEKGSWVWVICERVPALFRYQLQEDSTLRHSETIKIPGNPLDVAILGTSSSTRLLVAMEPSEQGFSSLLVVEKASEGETDWKQTPVPNLPEGSAPGGVKIGAEELRKILYTTESLRKLTDFD